MNSVELMDRKEQLKLQAEALLKGAESESRKMNDEETNSFNKYLDEIKEVDEELRKIENELKDNKVEGIITDNQIEKRNMKNFSLLKAINAIANNQPLDETAQAVVNAGKDEMRKSGQAITGQIQLPVEERAFDGVITAGNEFTPNTNNGGKENVAEDKLGILEPLRANLIMAQAGATIMTGLVGDISIPVFSGSNVGWEGEVDPAKNGTGTFAEVKLSPKRLTAFVDVSKQFLIQDSNDAEAMLKRDIVNAISEKLEATILGDEAGSPVVPEGIFYNVPVESTPVRYEDIVDMEAELELANVSGNINIIASPRAKAILKTTRMDAGSGRFVMEDGEVDGYKVYSSSAVTDKGIVLGNFNDYVIAQWGAIDLTVDPYTQAANGKIRLVINAYFDAKARRNEAFVKKVLL